MEQFERSGEDSAPEAVYTAFLTNKGKINFDGFIIPFSEDGKAPEEPDVLLDCHSAEKARILKHIKMYKLRSKVDVTDVSTSFEVWSVFHNDTAAASGDSTHNASIDSSDVFANEDSVVHSMQDPRLDLLGHRVVVKAETAPNDSVQQVDASSYSARRMSLGVAEGIELESRMPLECNLAALDAVSFDKGCYVGQELVARTHYKGKIRKRIMPFTVDGSDNQQSLAALAAAGEGVDELKFVSLHGSDDATSGRRGKPKAKLVAVDSGGRAGLAMVRLEALENADDSDSLPLGITDKDDQNEVVPVAVRCPTWWPQEYRS